MLRVLLITVVVISVPLCALADSLSVTNLAFGTGIEKRAITGVDTVFSVDQGRLYCWTVVEAAGAGDTIYHLWSHNDRAVQKIALAVRGARYRTHSYKTLSRALTGTWSVEVTDTRGRLLAEDSVTVEKREQVTE